MSYIPGVDFVLQDNSDGTGPFIAQWNHADPQPAVEALLALLEQQGVEMVKKDARSVRETILNRLAGIQLNTENAAEIAAIKQARIDMLNITAVAATAVNSGEAKTAIMAEWKRIALALALAAPAAATVFKGLDV